MSEERQKKQHPNELGEAKDGFSTPCFGCYETLFPGKQVSAATRRMRPLRKRYTKKNLYYSFDSDENLHT